jgi:hypothetical protein
LENQLERQKSISEENKTYENVLPQNQSNLQREIDDILRDQRSTIFIQITNVITEF